MSKVFIVQEPLRKNHDTGNMESFMDFRKTLEYGDPVVCLPAGRVAFSPAPMITKLKEALKDYGDDDYIVPTGDPTAIGAAIAIAGRYNLGKVNVLKWDKDHSKYIKVELEL